MFAFKSPCAVGWNPGSNITVESVKRIFDECKEKQVLKINLKYSPGLFRNDRIYTLFDEVQKAGVGIESNFKASEITEDEMDKIDRISDFVNIIIDSGDDADRINGFVSRFTHSKKRIRVSVDKKNVSELENIIDKYESVSEYISAIFCNPKYLCEDISDMLLQDETDDLSVDLIDLAERFENSFPVCYEDGSDEIRCLLSDKTVTSSIFIDSDGAAYINEWFRVCFGNVYTEGLDKIWDKSKTFWFLDNVKMYFSNFTSLFQEERLECSYKTVNIGELIG